jgi:hypothetical protein
VLPAPEIGVCGRKLEQLMLCMNLTTSFHRLVSSEPNLHIHLYSRTLFLSLKDPIPRPPILFGRVTIVQLTLHNFLLSSFPDHRKALNFLSIVVATVASIGNRDK